MNLQDKSTELIDEVISENIKGTDCYEIKITVQKANKIRKAPPDNQTVLALN